MRNINKGQKQQSFSDKLNFDKESLRTEKYLKAGLDIKTWVSPIKDSDTCKILIDNLLKAKKKFHNLRQNIHNSQKEFLNTALYSDKKKWIELEESIKIDQEKVKKLIRDIEEREKVIQQKLSSAILSLNAIINGLKERQIKSTALLPLEKRLIIDLKTLKNEVDNLYLSIRDSGQFPYTNLDYPTYYENFSIKDSINGSFKNSFKNLFFSSSKNEEEDPLAWSEKNEKELKQLNQKLEKEKDDDFKKDIKINQKYKKIVDAAYKVMADDYIQYTQSWRYPSGKPHLGLKKYFF